MAAMLRSVSVSSSSSYGRSFTHLSKASRIISTTASDFNLNRSITISSINRSILTTTETTSSPTSPPISTPSSTTTTSFAPPPPSSSTPSPPSTSSSSSAIWSYRSKPENVAFQILRTSWLPSDSVTRTSLQDFIDQVKSSPSTTIDPPAFLSPLFETIRSYRAVRSRLWIPDSSELSKANARFQSFVEKRKSDERDPIRAAKDILSINIHGHGGMDFDGGQSPEGESAMSETERERSLSSLEKEFLQIATEQEALRFRELSKVEQQDLIYRKVWSLLTTKERKNAMSRVSFECIRRLGWRKGFSSGYPLNESDPDLSENDLKLLEERRTQLNALLPTKIPSSASEERTLKVLEARRSLNQLEEKHAFEAWNKMSPSQKKAEEISAWSNRDRGRLYVSGGSLNPKSIQSVNLPTKVLGLNSPRWYDEPVRVGDLIYLPNTIIRLVKNHTAPNEAYDPYKATFRIPYSMHKHALKNYLLSIYGLRVTWIRTMIYRSSRARSAPGGSRDLRDRGFGRRNFKKAEVGLYEPFLFPEIGETFKRQGLLGDEMEVERMSGMLKLRGGKRWRSTTLPDIYQDENGTVEESGSSVHKQQLPVGDDREILTIDSDGVEGNESISRDVVKLGKKNRLTKRPTLLVRSGGIPTARHSRILQMLGWKNQEREEKIREIMQGQKDAGEK